MKPETCPCCGTEGNDVFDNIEGYDYFECSGCGSIFIDSNVLSSMDQGQSIIEYNKEYWGKELGAARERSYGQSLARVGEALLYARTPVRRFLDIGTGSGYLLDALAFLLPSSSEIFHGIEKFPPEGGHSDHPNYHIGSLGEAPGKFQAGTCIEVIEHLTPKMLRQLFIELKDKAEDGSIFLFNTGLPDYVRNEDRGYLDPTVRGHVVSYSLKAIELLSADLGFSVLPISGRSWIFLVEFNSKAGKDEDVSRRVWTALDENRQILCDPLTGSVLHTLGMESAREHANAVKKHVSALQVDVAKRDDAIAVLRRTLAERDKHLALYRDEVARRDERIGLLQDMVDEREQRSATLQNMIHEREKWAAELQGRLAERNRQLTALLATIAERDGKVAALQDKIVERDNQIAALQGTLGERDRHIALYGKEVSRRDERVAALQDEIVERDNQIVALQDTLGERDRHITLYGQEVSWRDDRITALQDILAERDRQIGELLGSTSWRVTKPLRTVRGAFRTNT